MANQTANREFEYKEGMRQLAYRDAAALTRYRGEAVAILQYGTAGSVGYLTDTFDGTVQAKFVGVNLLNALSDANTNYGRAVFREGAVEFVRGTTSDRWVGKPVWFSDNQTVKTTPTGRYPIFAGYVVEDVSTTKVLVEITEAVKGNKPWQTIPLKLNAAEITTASATNNFVLSSIGPAYIRQVGYQVPIGMSGTGAKGNLNIRVRKVDATASATLASAATILVSAATAGALSVGAAIDHDDKLQVRTFTAAGTPMAKGTVNLFLQVMPLV